MDTQAELIRFGQTLRQVREREGVSVADLATRTDIDAQEINAVEAGRLDPAFDVMCALADGIGVRLSALIPEDCCRRDACLRRYAFEVVGGHVESPAFVLVADVNQEDLSATDTEGAEVLDDGALPVETGDLRRHVVANFERVGGGCLSVGHDLEGITRGGVVPALGSGQPRLYRAMWPGC
jgi:transcriptional regulator with XRE-family HTH domain